MMKRTHLFVGAAVTIPIIIAHSISAFGIIGSIFPDCDYKIGIEHRTITHSLLLLAISTIAIYPLNKYLSLTWFINYLLHLILDSLTKTGVPFLYPFTKKYYGLKKFKTRGTEDYLLQATAIAVIVYLFLE